MLPSEKVRCSPSSPCSRAEARCAWLRVAARLPSPRLRAVLPFTAIIEQTAQVYREALGVLGGAVLEYHSAFEMEKEGQSTGQAAAASCTAWRAAW